jgi:hypothetical protein
MRTWNFEKCTVVEKEFNYDLHEFDVIVNDEVIATITPDSVESMESVVKDLDNGIEPLGWEDGMGNTITY